LVGAGLPLAGGDGADRIHQRAAHLHPRRALAEDAGVPDTPKGFGGFSVARNVNSPAEVDAALEEARRAGATIVKPGQEVSWGGYSGYFADPDGHLWEVAHNPFWTLGENGSVRLGA
jgi:uncharacterized glyoxalase superfamily protein PhnB